MNYWYENKEVYTMRQIILDTETTGLVAEQGHRIIEIGCVELVNRKLTGKHYHQYINPQREIDAGALTVHGITNEFLQDKPTFEFIVSSFIDFVTGAELIIHNAPFDVGFINAELSLLKKSWRSILEYCRVLDSLVLAKQLHVGQRNSLDALCKRYSIDNSQRELHGALLDAHLLARVYLAMTGGQATLFGDEESSASSSEHSITSNALETNSLSDLLVLRATSQEIITHESHIQAMASKGKCLWLESV
jgi:DNA polymerase-3 subunit epsilon